MSGSELYIMLIHLANVVRIFVTDDHSMFAFTMSCETVTCLAFVFAHGTRKPCSVDIVDIGNMTLQIVICFKHGLAHLARQSFNVDTVDLGKMSFQIATMFAFELALVARQPFNVDVVDVEVLLQVFL